MENFLKLQLQMAGPPTEGTKQQPKGAVAKAQAAGLGFLAADRGAEVFRHIDFRHDGKVSSSAIQAIGESSVSDASPPIVNEIVICTFQFCHFILK